jgi:rhodanese-related sulfurtransferase
MNTETDLPTVTPTQAASRNAGITLLDVREHDEWDAGHAHAAVHAPLSTLDPAAVPDGPLYVVCRSGGRSSKATAALLAAGREAHNVDGGMTAWEEAGLPLVTDDGAPGAVA